MKKIAGAFFAMIFMGGLALAADADGKITSIDRETSTIVLDDGKTYKLPGEFDPDTLQEGMEVLIAYDTINGVNLITDMELFE